MTEFPTTHVDWYEHGKQLGYTGAYFEDVLWDSIQYRDCFRLGLQHGREDFDKAHAEPPEK